MLLPFAWIMWAASNSPAQIVRIENPDGGVAVEVTTGGLQIQASSPDRPARSGDAAISEQPGLLIIKVNPTDGARVDLDVKLPYGAAVQVRTKAGAISARGLFASAELITETGELLLEAPWDASRFRLIARQKPGTVNLPKGFRFESYETSAERGRSWVLEDRLPEARVTWGRLQIDAGTTARVTLRNIAVPQDSPVKLPWQGPAALDAIVAGGKRKPKNIPRTAPAKNRPAAPTEALPTEALPTEAVPTEAVPNGAGPAEAGPNESSLAPGGEALFTSSVRMVNLAAAVYDENGRPMTGLKASDFTVVEDGAPQQIAFASAEEAPFNLVLLLDLSGSTKRDREDMKTAALRFLDIARPNDQVAVYALANNCFHVVSPLSGDREQLRRLIEALPQVSGGTPLYDVLVLSYAEELIRQEGERNALIVISDGVDNQIYGALTPSEVSFDKLRRAARQFDVLLYPILLNAAEPGSDTTGWARRAGQRMEELAAATGGRLFPARSLQQLEPVYAQVESELRAVYTLAYYPQEQKLDGAWHSVVIKVQRPGARVRSRDGYVAEQ